MDRKTKITKHLSNEEKIYEIMVENLNVEMIYDKSNKKIDECLLNILEQKYKMGWCSLGYTIHYKKWR